MRALLLLLLALALHACARTEAADVLPAIERLDPRFDALVPPGARLEKIADGFGWAEGPAWNATTGELWFSDVETNHMYAWSAKDGTRIVLENSGYVRAAPFPGREPGSNGITFDAEGRAVFCQHGERRISRLEPDGSCTVLVDRYQGKRLNSPNDLVYSRSGDLYFTDPPFGLPETYDDPAKELPFSGVYRLARSGELELLVDDLRGPNGIALSPDERTLYVGNWDEHRKVVLRFAVRPDGTTSDGEVFFDLTSVPGAEAIDGIKVDVEGRVYVAGPGGIFVLAPDGRHLGTIVLPATAHNFAFGDADSKSLYVTAESGLYRVPLRVAGVRPGAQVP
jgi:gluconolactonase